MINFTSNFHLKSVDAGDKSISHRALILAAIADGVSTIRNLSVCQDVLTTAECLRVLGARVEIRGTTATVHPIEKPCDNAILNCRNSGTTARLLAGLVAGLNVSATFYGDASLMKRPMQRVLEPLRQMGSRCECVDGALFKIFPSALHGTNITSQVNSAQVKSAVLIAGLNACGATTYTERIATRNHTENLLMHAGAKISAHGNSVTVRKSVVHCFDITVPNDFSSAAYLLALALLTGQNFTYKNVCVNPARTGFLRVLEKAGARFVLQNQRVCFGEQVADICVTSGNVFADSNRLGALYASERDVCDAIDEVPLLATLALTVKGKHRFCAVSELKHKECDRIDAILQTAKICRQKANFDGENLTIESNGVLPIHPNFDGMDDHRITMCQSVLAIFMGGGSVVNENFDVSFPAFLQAVGVEPLRFALIGEDVARSLSPALMRNLATRAQVCCQYSLVPLQRDVSDQTLTDVLRAYDGVNVTMPFKVRTAKLLSSPLHTVNTVGKNVTPTSTDGYGLTQTLLNNSIDVHGKPLWVVGAGGAAEACVQTLLQHGCTIQILNRTPEHAQALTKKYNLSSNVTEPYGILSFVPACAFEGSIEIPDSVQFVFVSDYKTESGLKRSALARGKSFIDGREMLYHQGAKSFALWTGTPVQTDYESFKKEIQQ